jgi:hypothetical protein
MPDQQFFVEEPATQSLAEPAPAVVQKPTKRIKTVSFSQYAMWLKCPQQWKLNYIDRLAPYKDSINTVFGDSIHEALQAYLKTLYTVGAAQADALNCYDIFIKSFDVEIAKRLKVATNEQANLTEEELDAQGLITPALIVEFKLDGKNILEHVTGYAIRSKHFPSKKYELLGIELPLEIPIRGGTIIYKGYLDIVLRDKLTKKILILDIKTSSFGWNKFQKMDRTKIDQLLLYKRFYNQLYKVPMADIDVEFFIVKRKLYKDVDFPQQRIQRVTPPAGKISIKEVETAFLDFINNCFDGHGEFNRDATYLKNPDKGRKNCKYCPFKTLKNDKGELYCNGKEG